MSTTQTYHSTGEIDPVLDGGHQHHTPSQHSEQIEAILAQVAAVDDSVNLEQQRKAAQVLAAALATGKHFDTPLGTMGHEQLLHLLSQLPEAVSRQHAENAAALAAAMDRDHSAPPVHAGPGSGSPANIGGSSLPQTPESADKGKTKAVQGSEEWSRQRKDNHKEVERRRRGNINEGITELARIVPNGEKNKGAVLQRAVQYIHQLKENEARNIEKWTLEKLLMDQAMGDLQAQLEEIRKRWEAEREGRERAIARVEELEVRLSLGNGEGGSRKRSAPDDDDDDEGPEKRQRHQ